VALAACGLPLGQAPSSPKPVNAKTTLDAERGKVVFADDFKNARSGWVTGAVGGGPTTSYTDAGYVVVAAKRLVDNVVHSPYALALPQISVAATDCSFHIFIFPWTNFTECDKAKDFLTKSGLSFQSVPAVEGQAVQTTVGATVLQGFNADAYKAALAESGYPAKADSAAMNTTMVVVILTIMMIYVTMVYGPIAAWLVELFPTRIRYSGLSLPYHIGNGWFGGFLPATVFAIVAATGDIYSGLWYVVIVASMSFVVGLLFLPETKDVDITKI